MNGPERMPSVSAAASSINEIRLVMESALLVLIAGLLLRTFVVGAYLVSSGSMAPTVYGNHAACRCPSCGRTVDLGIEAVESPPPAGRCPYCAADLSVANLPVTPGDRLLVLKNAFSYRSPRRFEPIVFFLPGERAQPFVKRVVGLPGEEIQISDGDVVVNGTVARKDWSRFQSVRLPVPTHGAADSEHPGWREIGERHVADTRGASQDAVLQIAHRDRDGFESPVRNELSYNGLRLRSDDEIVKDLVLSLELRMSPQGQWTIAYLGRKLHEYKLVLDGTDRIARVFDGDALLATAPIHRLDGLNLSFGVVDQSLRLAIGDREVLAVPLQWKGEQDEVSLTSRPFALVASGAMVEIRGLRIDRDIHYSQKLQGGYRPTGVYAPYKIPEDSYFVLGDNSPISQDSRAWDVPSVPRRFLVGKPFLLYAPFDRWREL